MTAQQLVYNRPAEFFEEALPIGNGRIGAMVYGGTAVDSLSLNDITLWTGEPDRGLDHPDLKGWVYDGCLEAVRGALSEENYPLAESLNCRLQGHYSENYQPLGRLYIEYDNAAEVTDYKRSLDISKAVAEVFCRRGGKAFRAEYFASSPDSVIVIRLRSKSPFKAKIRFSTPQRAEISSQGRRITADGYTAWHSYPRDYMTGPGQFLWDPERGIHFRTVISADAKQVKAIDGGLEISGRRAEILIVNSTSFAGFDRDPVKQGLDYKSLARNNIDHAEKMLPGALRRRHEKDYRALYGRFSIDLGRTPDSVRALPTDVQLRRYTDLKENNPELEVLYCQFGRYLLISSSRTPAVPANLQGLWNENPSPPWSSNYTTNINLEENYWGSELTGLGELHAVLLDFIKALKVNGEAAARDIYGITPGWCLGQNSDIWALAQPVGLRSGHPSWANWTMGGAWLSTHIWEHYLFSRDKDRLKEDYPALKGAAGFLLEWLVEKDGELISSPGTSPENLYLTPEGFIGSTLYGCTADLAIARECLMDASAAAKLLGDEEFAARTEEALAKLRPFRIGKEGALQEWYHDWKDYDPCHRHQSHLFGLYPGHQITPADPALAAACAKTLQTRGFETTGWSCAWRINLYARLGDGENAYRMLRRLLRYVSPDGYSGADARRGGGTYPNLMDAHSPFQIDGNFGGSAAIVEMLVQSSPEGTQLLPALPKAWPDGYVRGVRTREGKSISFKWKDYESQ
ncbi:MAG: glycoside hydrolase N-terminal domain-containing protein [Bacteroidales bacterium]|nr:glycoside hydrolase N-terminal domain-containing protein [Bacteroidales bacterium]